MHFNSTRDNVGGQANFESQTIVKRKSQTRLLQSRFTLQCLCGGSVLLVLFDWSFDLGLLVFPVSKYTRALLLFVFLIYIFRTGIQFDKFRFPFGRVLAFFALLNIIYSSFSSDLSGNLFYSSRILFWLLGTVVAYRLTVSGILSVSIIHKTIIATVFLGASFTIFLMTQFDVEAGQNASAYLILWCLPFLMIVKKSRLGNIVIVLAVFAILLTVKRGAMISLGLSLLAYGLTYLKMFGNIRTFFKVVRVCIVLAIVGFYALSANWEGVQKRFQDTSGSGRDKMYTMLVDHWMTSDPINFIFGFGIQSVQKHTAFIYTGRPDGRGIYAHSDWLQLTHDFGLLGIIFLVWLHFRILTLIRLSYKRNHPYTPSLVMGYVILFLVNIYSGHLIGPDAVYFGLLLAFLSASITMPYSLQNPRFKI